MDVKTITLKVAEALQIDYAKRIIRMDSSAREQLGVTTGDVVEITGKRNVAAIVLPAHPSDEGLGIIRMDGILRQNASVGLGDRVKIAKAVIKPAKRVMLAPNQPSRYAPGFDQYVKKNLIGKPLSKGDVLSVNVFGTSFPFAVAQTNPTGLVIVNEQTELVLREEPMKELGKIATISYGDLGGLRDEVQKIREMVELPMRHPELFETLGIEPPKGVLIYGSPGTGKTLLAKAVANESEAHFITIAGPEVVSKFVGEAEEKLRKLFAEAEENAPSIIFIDEIDAIAPKREEVAGEVEKRIVSQLLCVSPDTKIYTTKGVLTIKDLYESTNGEKYVENGIEFLKPIDLEVNSLAPSGKILPTKVTTMNKLFVPDAFEVKLDTGAALRTSAIQRFCTIRNGQIDWTPITELKEGDYVAFPTEIKLEEKKHHLFDLIPEKYSVKLSSELSKIFGRSVVNLSDFYYFKKNSVLKKDGTMRSELLNYVRRKEECTLEEVFGEFVKNENQKILVRRLLRSLEQCGSVEIVAKGRKYAKIKAIPLPELNTRSIVGLSVFNYFQRYVKDAYFVNPLFELTPELSELLGYVIADGSLSKNRLNVAGGPDVIERVQEIVLKLFGKKGKVTKKNDRNYRLDLACQTAPSLLRDLFGIPFGKKAFIVKLPKQLFTASNECKRAFIKAYFDCDGTVSSNLRAFSRSKQMMEDLSALLYSLGFQTSYSFAQGMHYCNILGGSATTLRYASEIGSVRQDRLANFQSLLFARRVSSSIQFVPNVNEALNAIRSGMDGLQDGDYRYLSGVRSANKEKLAYFLGLYQKEKTTATEKLNYLLHASMSWTRILSIKEIPGMEMYDLTTETENFVGGNVPTLLHNTLMDGLKSRGKVVVIGATNRPNSIDPALRRPGRFDREIEIGVPDKKGRREILDIHTRGMPLAKNVSLDELAAVTHGFVGADLQSLCKEAAMKVLRRILPKIKLEDEAIPAKILEELKVEKADFMGALREIHPSALREVYVEVPNVKWEQVGGLEEAKRELKEAVDLPIKHPEVFERIGIRPVRGILLFGPPGTGKTLLAKAVATESEANFIAVKGPELLNKWVGESLAYDEPIWIKENGQLKRIEIGKLVDEKTTENSSRSSSQIQRQKTQLLTYTIDESGKCSLMPVDDFIRHSAPKELYRVTTQTGRQINTTADHSLFTLQNGLVSAIPSSKLIEGESRVALPARLPTIDLEATWDLVEAFKENKNIYVSPSALFENAVLKLGAEKTAELLNMSIRYVTENIAKAKNALSLPHFLKLMHYSTILFDSANLTLLYRGSTQTLPGRLNASRDLSYVIGFWVAEGDYNRNALRFSNYNKENRQELIDSLVRLGVKPKEYKACIRAEHPLLKLFFREVLSLAPYADNKRVPDFIFAAPRSQIAAFLRAYYSGDGSVHGNNHRSYIEGSTSSPTLARDLQHLLLHFGIVATIWSGKEKLTGGNKFKVLFSGVSNFERFLEVGFSQNSKQQRLAAYPASKKWRRSGQIPLGVSMRAFLASNGYPEWLHSETIGIDKLRQALEKHDAQRQFTSAWELVESDYYWDKVTKVEKIPYDKPFVYDVSVPGPQRFLAGNGDMLVHNSEKGLREIFRKARQAAPCIIFMDELDAIVPMRGREDGGNNVTERMVNQLLSEIDGIQELNGVVVIGSTNRIDIIDSALLRPGRFDKLIAIGLPEKQTRFEIFKIHTANMPVSLEVNFEDLAKRTEGYSGADIEAMCREAGMIALRENLDTKQVTKQHFEKAFEAIRPSLVQPQKKETIKGYG